MQNCALRYFALLFFSCVSAFHTTARTKPNSAARAVFSHLKKGDRPAAASLVVSPGSLAAFTTAVGNASAQQAVTVSGTELTGDVTATAPAGFEISWTAGASFSATRILTQSGGTVANVPLYIRMTGAALGSFSGNVTIATPGATPQTVAVSGTVTAAPTPNPAARITSVSPNSGGAGPPLLVNFYGTGFVPGAVAGITGGGLFSVGPTTFVSANHVTAMVTVRATSVMANGYAGVINPPPGGGGGPSIGAAVLFTAEPSPPIITSFSPTSGPVGTVVTIRGTSISVSVSGVVNNPDIFFNGTRSNSAGSTMPFDNEASTQVPAGATTGLITLANANGGAVSATPFVVTASLPPFFEDFETGTKTSYVPASVQLQSGGWTFAEALIGTTAGADKFNGTRSARLRGGGVVEMDVDKPNGAGTLTVSAANYSTEAGASFVPEISSDGGVTYASLLGSSPAPTLTNVLTPYSFPVNRTGNVRLRFRSTNATAATNPRLNLDDIGLTDYRVSTAVGPGQALPELAVFPNPAVDRVTVRGLGPGPARASLHDLAGRQLLSPSILANGQLNLPTGLPTGVYLLKLSTPNGQRTVRLAKQ